MQLLIFENSMLNYINYFVTKNLFPKIKTVRTHFLRKSSAMHGGSLVCSRGSCRAGAAHPGAAPQRKLRGARRIGWDGVLADVLPQQTPFLVCGTADVEVM